MNLLFDLDGTIGDTLPLCIAAFREAIEPSLGKSLSDADIIAQFGPSEEGTIMTMIPEHYNEGMKRYLAAYERMHHMCPTAFEGMPELLRDLKAKGYYVGMVTGKGAKSTEITLEKYGLSDVFDVVRTGSIEGPVKDKHFRAIIKKTGIPANDFLYIGDTPSDITASHSCGMPIVVAAWAKTADMDALKALKPEYLFESIGAFREYLESLA